MVSISSVDVAGGRPVVRVDGDVDLVTSPELAGTLWRLIADGHELIEVDLQRATFMSCRGIAVMIAAMQLASPRGQEIRLVQPSAVTRRVFRLGGVARLLDKGAVSAERPAYRSVAQQEPDRDLDLLAGLGS